MIQRGNRRFMVPSEAHEAWHMEQMLALRRQCTSVTIEKVKACIITFYFPDNRKADLSNKAESIMDLLVNAGVLSDDAWQMVPRLDLRAGGIDKEKPRVHITLDV